MSALQMMADWMEYHIGETNILTRVVTQFVQFLSDNRATSALDEQASAAEEEDMELTA
jgi:hypothetical protein